MKTELIEINQKIEKISNDSTNSMHRHSTFYFLFNILNALFSISKLPKSVCIFND